MGERRAFQDNGLDPRRLESIEDLAQHAVAHQGCMTMPDRQCKELLRRFPRDLDGRCSKVRIQKRRESVCFRRRCDVVPTRNLPCDRRKPGALAFVELDPCGATE